MAWQWRYAETIEAAGETFANAIGLMEDNPEFIYAQDQAALYAAVEQKYPALFERIRGAVEKGQWRVVGGKWCESTMELTCGESLVRQYLYGVRHYRDRLGVSPQTDWQPEGSNYLPSFPQVLRQAGIRYAVIGRSADFQPNRPPFFWWEGLDGARILTAWLAAKEDRRAAYNMPTNPQNVLRYAQAVVTNQKVKDILYLYGRGDHGGGPSQRDLEGLAAAGETGQIALRLSAPERYFGAIEKSGCVVPAPSAQLAQGHGGFHTTCVETKTANRHGEHALYDLEVLATLAHLAGVEYPQREIELLWKDLLLNQFHDIIWGTTTYAVYREAQERHASLSGQAIHLALLLAQKIGRLDNPAQAGGRNLFVLNSLPFERGGLVESQPIRLAGQADSLTVRDLSGKALPTQILKKSQVKGAAQFEVLFDPGKIPGIGYKCFAAEPGAEAPTFSSPLVASRDCLENSHVRVQIDLANGHVSSILWKRDNENIELLPEGSLCNALYVAEESPDATLWGWGNKAAGEPVRLDEADTIEIVEQGPLRASVAVTRHFRNSTFRQTISLESGSPMARFHLETDWHEPLHRLIVRLPFAYESFRYDLPLCVGEKVPDSRRSKPGILAHEWVDLVGQDASCALLNDSRYAFDLQNEAIDMVILRSPRFLREPDWIWQALPGPLRAGDPEFTDFGPHEVSYALLPHEGDWLEGNVAREARAFNTHWRTLSVGELERIGPAGQALLTVEPSNVVLTALKKAEDSDDIIVRVVEQAGRDTQTRIHLPRPAEKVQKVSLLEEAVPSEVAARGNTIEITLKAHEIASFKTRLAEAK